MPVEKIQTTPARDPSEIDTTFAIYSEGPGGMVPTGPATSGSRPKGRGKWGQFELAGNVGELARGKID